MMLTKEFIKANLKNLNGFLPTYKPRNICCNKLLNCLKNELYFSFDKYDINFGQLEVNYARHLDIHASGILTFILGYGNYRRRNFVHAEYKYRMKIEFGVEREFNTIDGEIIQYSDIDHINSQSINDALMSFQGIILQRKTKTYFDRDLKSLNLPNDDSSPVVECLYKLMPLYEKAPELMQPKQKYPLEYPLREASCYVNLINYTSPYGWFEITSSGAFTTRSFVYNLGEMLKTKASQVDLIRVKEGPISLGDLRLVQFHENNLETYIERMNSLEEFYDNYIKSFDDMFPTPMRLRKPIK